MIRLFTCWFDARNAARQAELQTCVQRNLQNPAIQQVVLWKDSGDVPFQDAKLIIHAASKRPTFDELFQLANRHCADGDIAVIANTDIWFDDTIALAEKMRSEEAFALLRREIDGKIFSCEDGRWREDSQDSWIFRTPIRAVGADFEPGRPRCDNALAYRLWRNGYDLKNPALSISSHHVHVSSARNYRLSDRVPRPWMYVLPAKLGLPSELKLLRWKIFPARTVRWRA